MLGAYLLTGTVIATTLFAGAWLFVIVFAELMIARVRPRPFLVAIATFAAVTVLATTEMVSLPPAVQFVMLPIVCAAIASFVSLTKSDWEDLRSPQPIPVMSTALNITTIVVAALTGYVSSLTWIGGAILNALGQDVLGHLPDEFREIRMVGAIVGCFIGAAGTITAFKVCEASSRDGGVGR